MPLTLISVENLPLDEICKRLKNEGIPEAQVSTCSVDKFSAANGAANKSELIILVSQTQEFISTGGIIDRIRNQLTPTQQLVLCMARPTDYQRLLGLGVNEVISPADQTIECVVERILGHLILAKFIKPYSLASLYGATKPMQEVYKRIKRFATHKKIVFLLGETGTGKGLVAEALHQETHQRGKFMLINCGGISEGLKESLLFGSIKGAFTNATTNRKGLIEAAQDGTAFFDEIGDLNPALQITLLDVLEHNRVLPVGAIDYREVNARYVFATHRDLEQLIADGDFREDLYERINVLYITLPPLRKRKADIPLLADHLVKKEFGNQPVTVKFGPGAIDELFRHEWRRNVRELSNVISRVIDATDRNGVITDVVMKESIRNSKDSISETQTAGPSGNVVRFDPQNDTLAQAKDRVEAQYFRTLWKITKGNIKEMCRLADVSKSQVFDKLKKYGISRSNDEEADDFSDD